MIPSATALSRRVAEAGVGPDKSDADITAAAERVARSGRKSRRDFVVDDDDDDDRGATGTGGRRARSPSVRVVAGGRGEFVSRADAVFEKNVDIRRRGRMREVRAAGEGGEGVIVAVFRRKGGGRANVYAERYQTSLFYFIYIY